VDPLRTGTEHRRLGVRLNPTCIIRLDEGSSRVMRETRFLARSNLPGQAGASTYWRDFAADSLQMA